MRTTALVSIVLVMVSAALTGVAVAQCPLHWVGETTPGVTYALQQSGSYAETDINRSIYWDPDGAGPLPKMLVIAGNFDRVESTPANSVAYWNHLTRQWVPLGNGFTHTAGFSDEHITALGINAAGELVAGSSVQWTDETHVSRWDGSAWVPVGGEFRGGFFEIVHPWAGFGGIHAFQALPSGELVAAGRFTTAGGVSVSNIAKWNGTTWAPLGTGTDAQVNALAYLSGGGNILVAGGDFNTAGGVTARGVARWNGTNWVSLNTDANVQVRTLVPMPNGDLVAGGQFGTIGGINAPGIARWNRTAWASLGSGMNSIVRSATVLTNGDLVAAGDFTNAGGVSVGGAARWNGSTWSNIPGALMYQAFTHGVVAVPPGNPGEFIYPTSRVGQTWTGTDFTLIGNGFNNRVMAFLPLPNGDLIAGGNFTHAGAVDVNCIAMRVGGTWTSMGQGIQNDNANAIIHVSALARMPNGDIIAAGAFSRAGGLPANNIARWNGSAWSPLGGGLGSGVSGSVSALAVMPSGELIAGGLFTTAAGAPANFIARWNGSSWQPLGGGVDDRVNTLTVLPSGDLFVGGAFENAGGSLSRGVARWTGSAWLLFPTFLDSPPYPPYVATSALTNQGDLVIGGRFDRISNVTMNHVARWNGSSWLPMGAGFSNPQTAAPFVAKLLNLGNGPILAVGSFTASGATTLGPTAVWNGSQWSQFAPLTAAFSSVNNQFYSGALLESNGNLLISGGINGAAFYSMDYAAANGPTITLQPASVAACGSGPAALSVAATGGGTLNYRWQVEGPPGTWTNLGSAPMTLANGGTAAIAPANASTVSIAFANRLEPVKVRAVVSNTCASVSSTPAWVYINHADMGEQGGIAGHDGVYDNNDFIVFIGKFFAQDPLADVGSQGGVLGGDATFDNNDFVVFINLFFQGC
jgi:hypothetical protein